MYHPPEGDAFEFIEFQNRGAADIDLTGSRLAGIQYRFPDGTILKPNQVMVVISDANLAAFQQKYPDVAIAGTYSGRLSNGGERIAVVDSSGEELAVIHYSDEDGWPKSADGGGYSLELIHLDSDGSKVSDWAASQRMGGSPGRIEASLPKQLLLNEINGGAASASAPADSAFIELINLSDNPKSPSGWTIEIAASETFSFTFSSNSPVLAPGEFEVVSLDGNTNAPGLHAALFKLSGHTTVTLKNEIGNVVDSVQFGRLPVGNSLGRIQSKWDLVPSSPFAANTLVPKADPSVLRINEWYANASPAETDWLEVFNTDTRLPVNMHNLSLSVSGKTTRIESYLFLEPGGFLQLFADEKSGLDHVNLKLPAEGATLQLYSESGGKIDSVSYGAQSEGQSQGRLPDGGANLTYLTSHPTPGASNEADRDEDGIQDTWELQHGLDATNDSDANLDSDGDGLTNLQEFFAGTHPKDAGSTLKLDVEVMSPTEIGLSFDARANHGYSVLRRRAIGSGFEKVADLPSEQIPRKQTLADVFSNTTDSSFYVIATPQIRLPGEEWISSKWPSAGSTNIAVNTDVVLTFREPIHIGSVKSNTFAITDDLGRLVAGKWQYLERFHGVRFVPRLPLTHATTFRVAINEAVQTQSGRMEGTNVAWTFHTASSLALKDSQTIYTNESKSLIRADVKTFQKPGGFTLEDVHADEDPSDLFEPKVDVLFQAGEFGRGTQTANGTLQLRGQTARYSAQKSYRVELFDETAAWDGSHTINLNKHPYELTRMRNRLGFDLLRGIPSMTSLRTDFVHLFIDGMDYGLFTRVEQPDVEFLQNHSLDPEGHLYKATFFEFLRYPEHLLEESNPHYNKDRFSSILESKGDRDHAKLIRMLEDVNNPQIPIDLVIEKHFRRDNYLNWFAYNILTGNIDTTSQNFFLYSPSDSSAWYFLPWDFDGAFGFYKQPDQAANPILARWQNGLANWWAVSLHRRFLMEAGNLEQLNERVRQLAAQYLTKEKMESFVTVYRSMVEPLATTLPDLRDLPVASATNPIGEYQNEVQRLSSTVAENLTNFFYLQERPMPFFLGEPEKLTQGWRFAWDPSFDLQRDAITYEFEIGRSPEFRPQDRVFFQTGISQATLTVTNGLPAGEYFWRAIARSSKNPEVNWQVAFDRYVDSTTEKWFEGTKKFTVP